MRSKYQDVKQPLLFTDTVTPNDTASPVALYDLPQERASLAENEVASLKERLLVQSNRSSANVTMARNPDREDLISNSNQHTQVFEIAAKDKEIAALMEDVQSLQSSLNQIRETSAAQIRALEEQLDHKQDIIARLEARLESQRDYDEVKHNLSIIKSSCNSDSAVQTNGMDIAESKDKQAMCPRFSAGPTSLPVDTFGSLLGEELVATWRRSLERSLIASSPPTQLPANIVQHNLVNDSILASPQQCSPGNSSLNDSNQNFENSSLLNGSSSGVHERLPFRFEDSLIPKSDPMEARLQEMLRYNMDKFGSQCLDTLQISRRVRELLSIHNIGQRLFAKYVLGLSQGTVSELLSKPKPWDKLTEKGRDSYRKMHAWAADDASVLLLKSLIPKKGKESGNTQSNRSEEPGAEDRIAHILSEANHALHRSSIGNQAICESSLDDNITCKSPSNGCANDAQEPVSPSSSSSRDRRLRKYEHDDISQEQVTRIYQEELAKLVGLRLPGVQEAELRLPHQHLQSLLFPSLFGGSLLEREDIRAALEAYQRELTKLSDSNSPTTPHFPTTLFHNATLNSTAPGGVQDLSMPKRFSPELKNYDEKIIKLEKEESPDVSRHTGSAFSLVRPKTSEDSSSAPSPLNTILQPSCSEDTSNASPLQRMASITNSLISQPSTPSVSSAHQRPLKAVLPPITQQQFDQYNNLNTEDIVRKVKEQLSQYSISQRLFGESVLGLSQGSVSDLLARPKPWHMLTQKGREPFIRMKMFLEDDNAVHKLVASQYKIAPEKLMRTGGYAGTSSPTLLSKSQAKPTDAPRSNENSPIPTLSNQLPLTSPTQTCLPSTPENVKKNSPSQLATIGVSTTSSRMQQICITQQPSVYEMAALTQDLDTLLITTKIKEALLANNIGQKIFGEVVLGLSQGSVSELLSKPKPWHMLSIKGREPFIRMQLWLADTLNVERLQHLKNERREANKRKRGLNSHTSATDIFASGINLASSETSNDSPNESYSPGSTAGLHANKKQRVLFNDEQKEALRLAFSLDSYPNLSAIEFLGKELCLSSRTITNWFHNHRMRLKQQSATPALQDCSISAQTFDPIQFRLLLQQRLNEMQNENFPSQRLRTVAYSSYRADEGLDLSIAACRTSDNEDDYFDEEFEENEFTGSDETGESITSCSAPKRKSTLGSTLRSVQDINVASGSLGSSRRKPIAPQWLNPSWHDDSDDEEVLINGVCVLQNPLGYAKCATEDSKDTIMLEPSAPKELMKSSTRRDCDGLPHTIPCNTVLKESVTFDKTDGSANHIQSEETARKSFEKKDESVSELSESENTD